jgi:uncharacterized membrane protein
MSLTPLLVAPIAIQVHAFAAMGAFTVGLVQFAGPKGTAMHRVLGWAWVALMAVVAASSFWIHEIRQWQGFSVIHLLSIYVLVALPMAVAAARHHRISAHKKTMTGIFIGGLVVAGLFTFLPGRIMNAVLLGP